MENDILFTQFIENVPRENLICLSLSHVLWAQYICEWMISEWVMNGFWLITFEMSSQEYELGFIKKSHWTASSSFDNIHYEICKYDSITGYYTYETVQLRFAAYIDVYSVQTKVVHNCICHWYTI